MTDPLRVDDELKEQFNHLLGAMEDIVTFDPNREEGAYEALNERIHQAITNKPILPRIVNEMNRSLLTVAISHLNLETSHDVIKCLIQAYPAPITITNEWYVYAEADRIPIYVMAGHPEHCVLLPWIAINYPRVLDHELCLERPPVFGLLEMYAQRQRTRCTSTTLKQFFEAYPQALTQMHPIFGSVLISVLKLGECEADLFKWIAERCPSSNLLETDTFGNNPMHHACLLLSRTKTRNSNEICKYLIQKCPGSVRMADRFDRLAISYLQCVCAYRVVREVLVCLLRVYPESTDIQQPHDRQLPRFTGHSSSSIPFIQSIKPYLDEEKELKETAASLKESIPSLTEAVSCTEDELMRSAFTVFDSWATSFINSTEEKLQLISTQLQDMCNEGRGSNE